MLALILLVAFVGIVMELNLMHAIYRWGGGGNDNMRHVGLGGGGDGTRRKQLAVWYFYTGFAFLGSLLLGVNFILGILEIPSRPETGKESVIIEWSNHFVMKARQKTVELNGIFSGNWKWGFRVKSIAHVRIPCLLVISSI